MLNRCSDCILVLPLAFFFREKDEVVRNDFLDCTMELRKRGKERPSIKHSVYEGSNERRHIPYVNSSLSYSEKERKLCTRYY